MRKTLLLALVLLVSSARSASGQGGFNLFWDHCYADAGTTQKLFDCNSNVGSAVLIASVILPANMPQFAAATAIIDVLVADGSIPPWWQVASGQCRANAVSVSFDPTVFPVGKNCPAIWADTVPMQVMQIQSGLGGPDMFRVNSGAAVPPGAELSWLADGTELVVCRLSVSHAKSVGANACEGCRTGACFLMREMKLQQPAGVGDFTVVNPADNMIAGHNADAYIWVNFSNDLGCTTPALNRTWGAIKAMFR